MEVKRLFDIPQYRKQTRKDRPVFACKRNCVWEKHDVDEYIAKSEQFSYGLMSMGVERGENIALISSGRPEWNYIDIAVQQIGAIIVPIYPTISEEDYLFILSNSEVRYIIVETEALYKKMGHIREGLPKLVDIFTINQVESAPNIQKIFDMGAANPQPEALKAIKDSISGEDVATMIYTSGTTGVPKGVMLSHAGILANIFGIEESPLPYFTTALSWLPLCHIYERMMNYLYQYMGFEIYYAENVGKVAENAMEVHPHIMAAVPRFLEKVYDKIYRKGQKLSGWRKKVFFWAVDLGCEYEMDTSKHSLLYKVKLKVADKLVYKNIREGMGGNLDMLVSGGAAIQPRLTRFFSCVGLTLYEGYGLTECSPLVAVTNSHGGRRLGTVGIPLRGMEVKVDEDSNEIVCRGVNVMKGYYKAPDLTSAVLDADGWFHTGDTGRFDEDGFLYLTGRTKNMFKTSMGKFVNPEVIEEKFKESPFILEMMVVGEGQKFAAAIIAPDFDILKDWQQRHGLPQYKTREEMVADKLTLARFQRVVDKYNQRLGNTEQVKKWHLVTETWSEANKFLTPTLKIRRKNITEAYKDEIDKLFA